MKLPLINLPTTYHLGSMNPEDKGAFYSTSLEGNGLSVSVTPQAWEKIARLGGSPLWEITGHDAFFIDLLAMDNALLHKIQVWGVDNGFLEHKVGWRTHRYDSEAESWGHFTFLTMDKALEELYDSPEEGESVDDFIERHSEEVGMPNGRPVVEQHSFFGLTEKGMKRSRTADLTADGTDYAVMFYAEDVLTKDCPQIVGVWWDETYSPEDYSAPRGAILPSSLARLGKQRVDCPADDDLGLLDSMAATALVDLKDMKSGYRFITNCVASDGPSIDAMIHDPSVRELKYDEFINVIGDGDTEKGKQMLTAIFPIYAQSGMSMKDDWNVRYALSSFKGRPCAYLVHSAIEYVFQREGLYDAEAVVPRASPDHGPDRRPLPEQEEIKGGWGV